MAGQKISLLAPVSQVLDTDMFVIARGSGTYKVYGSTLATKVEMNSLRTTVNTLASNVQLERVRSNFASASAALTTRIDTVASTYTTTVYVNNQVDQAKVFATQSVAASYNQAQTDFIAKPTTTGTLNGNLLTWNGTNWISKAPPVTTVVNNLIDIASVGSVVWFAASNPPGGYLECNGQSVSRATYYELFQVIGTTYGSVDSQSFNLPDLRGEFIRGWDHGRGIDLARNFGSAQTQSMSSHTHGANVNSNTLVYTNVDTKVNTNTLYDLSVGVNTNVDTTVNTGVNSTIFTDVSTNVNTDVTSRASTSIYNTANTQVNTNVGTDVNSTANTTVYTTNINISSQYFTPSVNFYDIVNDGTGTYVLSTSLLSADNNFTISNTTSAVFNNIISAPAVSNADTSITSTAVSLATSTATTTITSDATTLVYLTATSMAMSLATSTAVSLASSTAVSLASSVATPVLHLSAISTAVSLASSTAVTMTTATIGFAGGTETRPRNVALLPCIKYTKGVSTVGLMNTLSSYVPIPSSAIAGNCIGYNGTNWTAIKGLPLSATVNQFLRWNGTDWVAGDYPSNLTTLYSNTFQANHAASSIDILNIPPTAKRITIAFSQIIMNGGTVVKINLGTPFGNITTNYKYNLAAIAPVGQKFLNNTDGFNIFGAITYSSVLPNSLIPINQTITSQPLNSTVTLTKTSSNTWVFANTGSIDIWSIFGGGSVLLDGVLDHISVSTNNTEFVGGNITAHWE